MSEWCEQTSKRMSKLPDTNVRIDDLLNHCVLFDFLGATKHLHKRVCLSIHPSISPSLGVSLKAAKGVLKHLLPCILACFSEIEDFSCGHAAVKNDSGHHSPMSLGTSNGVCERVNE